MGGVIALHLALNHPDRIAALVLIAPALSFTDRCYDSLTPAQRAALASGRSICLGSDYATPRGSDLVHGEFFEAARAFAVPEAAGRLGVRCPVRILHGARDEVVPVAVGERLVGQLAGEDVSLTVVKDGDHRLSAPRDLEMLEGAVEQLYRQLERERVDR